MHAGYFTNGALVGFCAAIPVGPIGVLCMRRSLSHGSKIGFISGLGAATVDAVYGGMAQFGMNLVADFLTRQHFWFSLVGGTILCLLGIRTCRAKPAASGDENQPADWLFAYVSTLLLTLANPSTILSFAAVFAGFGMKVASTRLSAVWVVLGIFAGSALWWLTLSSGVGFLRRRIGNRWLPVVNQISGVTLIGCGFYALAQIF